MVTVGAVQEGLAPLALLARRLEDAARWRVQGAPAAREPIFQVEAEGRNREVTSGSRGVDRLSHPPWSPAPAHRPRPRRSGVGLCFSLWGWRSEGMWGAGEPTQPLRTRAALHRTGFASHNCDSTLRGPDALSWLPTHVVLTHIQLKKRGVCGRNGAQQRGGDLGKGCPRVTGSGGPEMRSREGPRCPKGHSVSWPDDLGSIHPTRFGRVRMDSCILGAQSGLAGCCPFRQIPSGFLQGTAPAGFSVSRPRAPWGPHELSSPNSPSQCLMIETPFPVPPWDD